MNGCENSNQKSNNSAHSLNLNGLIYWKAFNWSRKDDCFREWLPIKRWLKQKSVAYEKCKIKSALPAAFSPNIFCHLFIFFVHVFQLCRQRIGSRVYLYLSSHVAALRLAFVCPLEIVPFEVNDEIENRFVRINRCRISTFQ